MGQKIHPLGFRLGISKPWKANWFFEKKAYANALHEDLLIRREIMKRFPNGGIDNIVTERDPGRVKVIVHTSRPGIIIGQGGSKIEEVRNELEKLVPGRVLINIQNVDRPDLSAALTAHAIARQIEERKRFRRVVKQMANRVMKNKALGVKIRIKGRLDGAEMGRTETHLEGRVPLHTLSADIDYASETAMTTYGNVGVKVWIYRGDIPLGRRRKR
jgi:small subunit ribosomal protein S3